MKGKGFRKGRKVLLDRSRLNDYVSKFETTRKIEVPELAEILKQERPCIEVKGASLDDHISARELSAAPMILLGTVLNMAMKGEKIDLESIKEKVLSGENIHSNTNFELEIFQRCVIKPKFKMAEVVRLSEVVPEFVNKVVKICLDMTALHKEANDGNRKTS